MRSAIEKPFLCPSPGYFGIAKLAAPLFQIELTQEITPSLYEYPSAIMAVSMASFVSGHVAQIDIVNSFLQSQVPEFFQRLYGRRWQPGQLVLRKKS